MSCPCGLMETYEECCLPYHDEKATPPTAEKLMRARYSAYVKKKIDFVEKTHLDSAGNDKFDFNAAQDWSQKAKWLGLKIISTDKGQENEDFGEVEFEAKYIIDGKEAIHHEKSQFKKVDGKWYFQDGDQVRSSPIKRVGPKIGRNDPCHCGSGKKFKKCCA